MPEPTAEERIAALEAALVSEREQRTELERRSAFAEAGFADHPARELLERAYEPGMTVEQVKAMATKYGIAATATPPANANDPNLGNANDPNLGGIGRIQNAATGSTPTGALPEFGDAIDRAQSLDELLAIIQAGGAGVPGRPIGVSEKVLRA